jgi:succinate dehydrogenase/fumarate reductase-like Fe-S protein
MMAVTNESAANVTRRARLKIWRGTSAEAGHYQEFDVAFEDGESVLDGLVRIRMTDDPDLAFRFSCFNANVCKECTMLIDGDVEYACIAKLSPRTIQLDPLPNRPILRDLITDALSPKEKL